MENSDLFNLTLVNAAIDADQVNKRFYERFNYPWPAQQFSAMPPGIARSFLNQDLGYWRHDRISGKLSIWIAGCGTNQALFTALKFPDAEVLGTDLSHSSIRQCTEIAHQIGVKNLTLEVKSLNQIDYEEKFDYIINTGVIHHNADPAFTLKNISRALKKNGVLELMVYNYYHRIVTTACQNAVRSFYDSTSSTDMELEFKIVQHLIADSEENSLTGQFLSAQAGVPDAQIADGLLQPIEYSYTVESFNKLAENCNLDLLTYCINQYDVAEDLPLWNMAFRNPELSKMYASLPDLKRWQITNLLKLNESPMVWFYLQRKDADYERKTESEMCDEFLNTHFDRNTFPTRSFEVNEMSEYILNENSRPYPSLSALNDPTLYKIVTTVDPSYKMKDIFIRLGITPTFENVNNARIKLTTLAFPYLISVS